jgi:hypothetical protein
MRKAGLDPEQKRDLARQLNEARRHLDYHELAVLRAKRVERAAEASSRGESQGHIAQREGVSRAQIQHDLREATRTGVQVDPPDGKVTGRDGKKYPARRLTARCRRPVPRIQRPPPPWGQEVFPWSTSCCGPG